jgi:L-ascorbate metabolism protein UlaG (beta-lactamase superfamily)
MEIAYVHHDCFILFLEDSQNTAFLFDYPDAAHRPDAAAAYVRDQLADRRVFCFFSHSHADHFSPDVGDVLAGAESVHYIVSEDVASMADTFDPETRGDVTVVEPEETRSVEELVITGYESTDLGVGYLVGLPGTSIWFSGDVARWSREGQDETARQFADSHFEKTLESLKAAAGRIDIAFAAADPRLPHWAGGLDVARVLKPRVFVPMHTFGRLDRLKEFADQLRDSTRLFVYEKLGDRCRPSL